MRSLLFLALATAMGSASAGEFVRVPNAIAGQYIVVMKPSALKAAPGTRAMARASEDATVDLLARNGGRIKRVYTNAVQGFSMNADERVVARMLKDPRVAFIEEDAKVSINAVQYSATWGLDRIDQRNRPLNGSYVYNATASGVRAYVIDTGILASHYEFAGRVGAGFTAINDGQGSNDCNGHGTHVAGTIAGSTWGVAKGATVVPVRVLGCDGSGTNSGVIAGIDWVRTQHIKPAVANMSLGGGASYAVDQAVNNLINAGVAVVVAAGNSNANACNYSPARVANAITVGASTSVDQRASFSNYGQCVDLFAPGASIRSAWHTDPGASAMLNGTSMASPHVAGAAAIYLSRYPYATPSAVNSWLLNNASYNRLSYLGPGSPNRLLYVQ